MKNSRDRSRAKPSVKPRLSDLYCGRIVRYHNTGKSGEKGGGYGWIEKRLDPSASSRGEYPKVWFHIKKFKRKFPQIAAQLDVEPNAFATKFFWFFVETKIFDGEEKEQVADIYTDIKDLPFTFREVNQELNNRMNLIRGKDVKTKFADDILLIVPDIAIQDLVFYENLLQYASYRSILSHIEYLLSSNISPSVLESTVYSLVRVGYAKELWDGLQNLREILFTPFAERLRKTKESNELQWLIHRLMEISDVQVIRDAELRHIAFRVADEKVLFNSINRLANVSQGGFPADVLEDLETCLLERFHNDLERIWNMIPNVKSHVQYHGFLWRAATDQIKMEILEQRYPRFLSAIKMCEILSYDQSTVSYNASEVFERFDEHDSEWVNQFFRMQSEKSGACVGDNELFSRRSEQDCQGTVEPENIECTGWTCPSPTTDAETVEPERIGSRDEWFDDFIDRLRIARAAEKVAIEYYTKLGFATEDISIKAVERNAGKAMDDSWKTADIKLLRRNREYYVDVKSCWMKDKLYYTDLFVKQFKSRRGIKVIYTGVVYKEKKGKEGDEEKLFTVLGEFQVDKLFEISAFCRAYGLDFVLSRVMERKYRDLGQYLPIYLFDYNSLFYRGLEEIVSIVKQLEEDELPKWEDIAVINKFFKKTSAIGVLLAAGKRIPNEWLLNLDSWEKELVDILYRLQEFTKRISLPFVLFSLLIHFLRMVSSESNSANYEPTKCLRVLSVGGYVLGIYDPIRVLNSFIILILEPLWASRSQIQKYKRYRLVGPQWLQGTTIEADQGEQWDTLVAWCQGCGFFPLVYGKNPTCQQCGRLICTNERRGDRSCFTCERRRGCKLNGLPPSIRPALQEVFKILEDYGMTAVREPDYGRQYAFSVQKKRPAPVQHVSIMELMKIVGNTLKNLGYSVRTKSDATNKEIRIPCVQYSEVLLKFSSLRDETFQENVSQPTH